MEFWAPGLIACLVCAVAGLGFGVKNRKKQNWKKGLIVIRYYLALRGEENGVTVMVTPFFCVQG